MSRERKKINLKKMTRKQKILAVVVLAVAVFGITRACGGKKEAAAPGAQAQKTAVVQRQDITSTLSASGSLAAKDSYNITSLVEGKC